MKLKSLLFYFSMIYMQKVRHIMKPSILVLLIVTLLNSFGAASITGSNLIVYKGDTLSLFDYPLEQLYEKGTIRPNLFGDQKGCSLFGAGGGYVAKWEITDNMLYLTGIYSCCYNNDSVKANLKDLFGEKCINGRVKATWVNGKMYSPLGRLLYCFPEGLHSIYENEVEFMFVNGALTGCKKLDNSKTKRSRYTDNQKLLHEYLKKSIKRENLPESDSVKRKVFVHVISSNENGKIDSVRIGRGVNELYDKEAIRIVKSIPDWDILYRHGEKVNYEWIVPVVFDITR